MVINKIHEDRNLIVIDKPSGLVVHPGAGEHGPTLVDWLINQYPEIKKLDWPDPTRPGIVHRLDKDTSGLMILAKNPQTLKKLQSLFKVRKIRKSYLALVYGKFDKPTGEIKSLVGRDPQARRRQVSRSIFFDFESGAKREAKTRYKIIQNYEFRIKNGKYALSLVEAILETGRTHQIRVQFKAVGHPIIGDPLYNIKHSRKLSKELEIDRQFLHAYKLEFNKYKFELKLPTDLQTILNKLDMVS